MFPHFGIPEHKGFRCSLYLHPRGWWGDIHPVKFPVRFVASTENVISEFESAVDDYLTKLYWFHAGEA